MSAIAKPLVKRRTLLTDDRQLIEKFAARKSHELVIAFAGPIGCGIQSVVEMSTIRLKERGYEVVHVKLSEFLEEAIKSGFVEEWEPPAGSSNRLLRYRRLQEAGKELRSQTQNPAILAEYAIRQISIDRRKRFASDGGSLESTAPIVPKRVAYLIDQVKRPEEVALLRVVYGNLFYLAGVTRIKDRRVEELVREKVRANEVEGLIEIDKNEGEKNGQQLDKTLQLADYFIRNDAKTIDDKRRKVDRFLDLIHGDKSVTPSKAEHGMYAAYAAGLRSACLSRQVGAAIAASGGEVISTGCNDVPKAGGGLYTSDSQPVDMRCVHQDGQVCFNDFHKKKLLTELGDEIEKELKNLKRGETSITLAPGERAQLLDAIYENTRVKDLIEFSRSVHAEMDAIVALVRTGGGGLEGATLYTTTFPCHNCARHIVAAGITKVFYIEPYEKSLAKDLHQDAIAFEVEESTVQTPRRVEFLHFEGVAPRQFGNMFRAVNRKDSSGKFIPIETRTAEKFLPEYIDSYQDFEAKAVQHLENEITRLSKLKTA
ncbi:anti-phage dCTP deaminase [Variovorax sp. CAN2819]|uniref:anti-phage dCTP deaminase n=1 Tax=Variovorax sp. CAN15 TaxID=3046727 RepID=UPI002648EA74|nr:anti-phage dCTP deaminase [Variovorax sp. CAN15]MDN6883829.1 anti-phage dCTP deaminase [Variovorax sp. CAN15]